MPMLLPDAENMPAFVRREVETVLRELMTTYGPVPQARLPEIDWAARLSPAALQWIVERSVSSAVALEVLRLERDGELAGKEIIWGNEDAEARP
jgi:hypothetical protein